MFKKILQSLSKSQAAKGEAARPAAAPVARFQAPPPPAAARAAAQPARAAPAPAPAREQTPEELCGIAPKTPKEQIQAQLKLLYRRYNRGASSLDPKVRAEAEQMLTAIVVVREKYIGVI